MRAATDHGGGRSEPTRRAVPTVEAMQRAPTVQPCTELIMDWLVLAATVLAVQCSTRSWSARPIGHDAGGARGPNGQHTLSPRTRPPVRYHTSRRRLRHACRLEPAMAAATKQRAIALRPQHWRALAWPWGLQGSGAASSCMRMQPLPLTEETRHQPVAWREGGPLPRTAPPTAPAAWQQRGAQWHQHALESRLPKRWP